ncbi:RHS repeat-associated core domain-containing protein [Flavobacterium hydrophilum]|uniref:DUF6443 domain-containing protein n=1 Tax=Flavobacterium hydrophilum TaxID=2211445 RepID=A0A2V4C566_9FLAO|nr:RHS repeat-associated core domain-containing protein [Flavobacterium hydrophilum]PXY46481.1 hypothetical protein DMB68_04720 [Flavobacterium hydrophilum]
MNIIFKNWIKKFYLLVAFCFSLFSHAQVQEQEYGSFTPTPLRTFTAGTVLDSEYNIPNQKNIDAYSYFSLSIDNEKAPYTGYSVTAAFEITPYDQSGTLLTAEMVTKTMTVNYNHNFSTVSPAFSDLNYFKIKNKFGLRVALVSNSIVVKDLSNTVIPFASATAQLNNVTVNMGFKAQRYYPLATTLISPIATTNANATAIKIEWTALTGAIEYELEWTWVDNYSETNSTAVTPPQNIPFTERNFDLNNTRIVIKANGSANNYDIPQIYSKGYLLYRIRGIGRNATNENAKTYGTWSSGTGAKTTVADWPNQITIAEHENNKNWQFQASYAEDGKKKEVVSYFDGSLRNRQTVTKINSDNVAIVGEVIYDTQGRPAIEILPTPAQDNTIHYFPNYNLFNATTRYSNKNFDYGPNSCTTATASMTNTVSGASRYYSANNEFSSSVNRNFIPDAKLFPFSQTEYTPDNTGRISRKGGVGDKHQLGSGHEMKYFYGVPSDMELNRLFGYKVGDVSHYKKNTVIDPNGQISVSYLDPQGRTIATALAGANSTNLESLPEETSTGTRVDNNLITNNTLEESGAFKGNLDKKTITKEIVVSDLIPYNFSYTLNQSSSFQLECQTPAFSYPFVYDLDISLKNNCGEEQLTTPVHQPLGEKKLDGIPTPVTVNKGSLISTVLTAGNYSLTKDLKVNESVLKSYITDYVKKLTTAGSSCYINPNAYKANATLLLESCNFGCQSCKDKLGPKATYVQNSFNAFYSSTLITASGTTTIDVQLNGATNIDGSAIDPVEKSGLTTRFSKEWDLLFSECVKYCDPDIVFASSCDVNEGMLLSDVSPNGQYGATSNTYINDANLPVTPNPAYKVSVFNNTSPESSTGNQLFYYADNSASGNNWKKPVTPYKNDDETIPWIEIETTDNETTFKPEIDRTYISIPSTERQKITNGDGSYTYKVNPKYLKNSADFIDNWNDGWAVSLVNYHPEYNYLVYSKALCGITKTINGVALTSDDYDNRIQNATTFELAKSNGFIDLAGTNFDLIYTNDPYFQSFTTAGIETTNQSALRYNPNTSGNTSIMYQALKSNYSGNQTMFQNAVKVVLCSPINNCSSAFSTASATQKDEIWNVYKSLYLGLKANIKHIYLNLYALEKKTYNGCIGTEKSKNVANVLGSSFATQKTAINNAIQAITATGTLCASTSAPLYAKLERRFIPTDYGYDSSTDAGTVVANVKAVNNYQVYAQTGNCPLLSDLDLFLNIFFKDPILPITFTTTNATYSTFNKQYLSANLLKALSPGVAIPTTTLNINSTSTGTKLDIRFSSTTPSITSGITSLTTPSSTYNWSGYGSTWKIINLKQFFYDKATSTPGSGIFKFKVIAEISNGSNAVKIGEILLTGTTSAAIGECGVDSSSIGEVLNPNATNYSQNVCDKETKFETAFVALLNELKANGTLNSTTPVDLYYYNNYRNNYLQSFFGSDSSAFWVKDTSYPNASVCYIKKADVIVAGFYIYSAGDELSTLSFDNFTSLNIFNNSSTTYGFELKYKYDGNYEGILVGEIDLFYNNFDCPVVAQKCIPQTIAPVACDNAKKTEYIQFINGAFDVAPALSNYSIDAASIQFCENNYQYIFDSYKAYINQMKSIGLTSAHDIRFRTISEFGNTYLNYGFSDIGNAITQYSAYYVAHATDADLLNWNDWVNIEFRKTNTLCPPAPLSNTFTSPMPADEAKTCDHFSINIDGAFGNDIYNSVIEAKKQKFIKDYITQAMTAVETFDMNYTDKEYQYTLYYYDQAGNLTQTVAPEGVKRMTLDKAANDNINAYRTGNDPAENTALQPAHTFKTQYKYNTLNQLVWQKTPDGGETRFAYDKLGRIIASQNANQAKPGSGSVRFSYTSYDGLGRITEAGEILNPNTATATTYTINDEGKLVYGGVTIVDAFTANIASKTEVTRTVYSDDPGVENWTPTVPPGVTPPVLTRNASYFFSDKSTTPALNNINRVTGVFYYDTYIAASPLNFNNAIFYNYDIHGNVKEVINYYSALRNVNCISSSKNDCEAHIKRVVYDYDLISGNVNTVTFQPNKPDLFVHKYNYDADNRIVDVQTSSDNVLWEKEANYKYYLHGPLARVELGNKKVQGIDYAYTLQGWLKAVNGENLTAAANDMGQDGLASGTTKTFDAFGYSLNYYDKDYKSIGSTDETSGFKPLMYSRNSTIQPNSKDLFNGNIKQMTTAIRKTDGSLLNIQKNTYTYDQLNRIKSMKSSAIVPNASSGTTSYDSSYSYDKNGNLQTLNRKAPNSNGVPTEMDKLTYEYPNETGQQYRNSNKLALVKDAAGIPAATFAGDLEDQVAKLAALTPQITYNINDSETHNYIYDDIGQLIEDKTEGILINWRVDGKVKSVVKGTVTYAFEYNGLGNRIAKKEVKPGLITTTYYAHDAQGNVLGVYEEKFKPKETDLQNDLLLNSYNVTSVALKRAINNIFMTSDGSTASVSANGNLKLQAGNSITIKNFTAVQGSTFVAQITPVQANNNESVLTLKEHHIFGSSRLGLETKNLVVYNSTNTSGTVDPVQTNFLSLIGDKHFELSNHLGNVLAVISDKKIPTAIAGVFNPDVLTYSDYYPFGMLVPNRHADSDKYRYGFQGQEMDNELKGEGNSLNYTFRMHDPRIGRFFAVDPLESKYPFYSPYQFGGNDPISSVELEGLEPSKANTPIQEPYKGGISNYEAEESKGTVPGGYSTSQRWKIGGYTITPNYVKTSENTSELSHYTASVEIKDIADGMKDVVRTDWIIPYAKLGEFKEKVQLFEGAANLMYGANAKLSDWQINYLNGNKKDALTGYLKEQWSDPVQVLFAVVGTIEGYSAHLKSEAKGATGARVNAQRMKSHGHLPETSAGTKSYMNSISDAKKVVDAIQNRQATIMKITTDGKVYVKYNGVSGTYMNNGVEVPTNLFYVQGIRQNQAKVVPVHPNSKF